MSMIWDGRTPLPFLVSLALIWCFVCFSLAALEGWRRLAEVYRFRGRFAGRCWRFRTAGMRWKVHYGGCFTCGANGHGLYLGVFFLFRFAHPPLFVPWVEIEANDRHGIVVNYLEFGFKRARGVPLRLPKPLALALLKEAGQDVDSLRRTVA